MLLPPVPPPAPQVAPVIHEWTYEAMAFDLLTDTASLRDNVFVYDAETQGGACAPGAASPPPCACRRLAHAVPRQRPAAG